MKYAAWACALMMVMNGAGAAERDQVMLVLDASGSMWGQIDGRSKVEIAREAVADLVKTWNPEVDLGLIAYGHRRKGDCADIETVLPAGPLHANDYLAKVNALNAKGMTPLSQAVINAADALKASERKATVILVSDGEETCELDPCAVGKSLEAKGVEFTAHVIGFDVPNPAHQAQLRCLAESTGGRYFNASDAASLDKALGQIAVASTEKPLPAVPATLIPPANIVAATAVEVSFDGPGEARDWVGFAKPGSDEQAYLDYDWVKMPKGVAVLRAPAEPGDYELRYVSARRKPALLAQIKVSVAAALATVSGPSSVMAGDVVRVHATGPADNRHWIGFAPKDSDARSYRDYLRPDASGSTDGTLQAPSVPGDYELRYVLNESEKVAASQPITVLPAKAMLIDAPVRVVANQEVVIDWSGPLGRHHWIGFIRKGGDSGDYLTYAYLAQPSPARFRAPREPGEYELAFVLGGDGGEQILARHPIGVD
ncbi:MAG: VWA domain-containing protein [Rhodanobacteraceae bacterium]|nr:VWA domain-containing protein [Rhodanobacteraceae bacterium]MBP9154683.1 VWA domain-containing protein [Xanthomonadales bacterium]HQW81389.1 VWA domain-containing protein [Pseudomonadota bacterium]